MLGFLILGCDRGSFLTKPGSNLSYDAILLYWKLAKPARTKQTSQLTKSGGKDEKENGEKETTAYKIIIQEHKYMDPSLNPANKPRTSFMSDF